MSDIDEIMALEESNRHCAKAIVRLERERDAANAYFHRACERLASVSNAHKWDYGVSEDEIVARLRVEIMAEVDKELERSAGDERV